MTFLQSAMCGTVIVCLSVCLSYIDYENNSKKLRYCVLITFCVSRRRREMYRGHARLCVCLSVCLSAAACLHYYTDPDVTWGSGRGCPLVVHYWADLQSMHGLRCYGNTRNAWQSPAVIRMQANRTPHAVPHTTNVGEDSPRQR